MKYSSYLEIMNKIVKLLDTVIMKKRKYKLPISVMKEGNNYRSYMII